MKNKRRIKREVLNRLDKNFYIFGYDHGDAIIFHKTNSSINIMTYITDLIGRNNNKFINEIINTWKYFKSNPQ